MKKTNSDVAGLLVIDKPAGLTSHDIVARTRRELKTRRVGHAGTLDPMATGVLVLGVGRATKLLPFIVGTEKEYLATIRLGASTTTDDAEGEVTEHTGAKSSDLAGLPEAIAKLTGAILQVPAAVSAIKVDGKRAYARVRAGEEVELKARPVTVSVFETLGEPREEAGDFVDLDVRVVCSAGTYIRALARDMGQMLGTGGHLVALRRTRVGCFTLAQASDSLQSMEEVIERLYPEEILVSPDEAMRFAHGVAPRRETLAEAEFYRVNADKTLGLVRRDGNQLKPAFIINPA